MSKFKIFHYLSFFVIFSSCVSNNKILYLQNLEGNLPILENQMINYDLPVYKLQFNDIIDVQIRTNEDFLKNGFGAPTQQMNMMQGGMGGGDAFYMTGYSIDMIGNIQLPMIGDVKVSELTLDEVRAKIEEELKVFFKTKLEVRVKLGGIRFSTLGEVRRPGKYVVLQNRMTIFEAIAQSGDLTNIAKRDEVLLIRQYPEGSKIHKINLNDRQIIQSSFYFIQPNDQIYVAPMKIREIGAGENAAQSLTLLVSSISAIALILNLVSR